MTIEVFFMKTLFKITAVFVLIATLFGVFDVATLTTSSTTSASTATFEGVSLTGSRPCPDGLPGCVGAPLMMNSKPCPDGLPGCV